MKSPYLLPPLVAGQWAVRRVQPIALLCRRVAYTAIWRKIGYGFGCAFRYKRHSTAAHSISRTGSTDVSPVRDIFVIVHFIHFFSLRQSQNRFRFAHSAKRKRCKKQLMKFFHEIAVSASSACRSAMSTVRRVQSNASLGRRAAYTAVWRNIGFGSLLVFREK